MSASSWLVTCGIMIAVAQQVGAADLLDARQLLALDRAKLGKVHLGPGHQAQDRRRRAATAGGRPWLSRPAPGVCDSAAHHRAGESLHVVLRDAALWGPLPLTSSSGTPSSRANLRTDGEACGRPSGATVGCARAGRRQRGGSGCHAGGRRGTATAARAGGSWRSGSQRHRTARAPSRIASRSPMLTLSPSLTLSSLITPGAAGRDFHRCLVGLDGDQALLGLDSVAHLDHHLNDGHVLEVTNVGHAHSPPDRWRRVEPRRYRTSSCWRRTNGGYSLICLL